MVKKLKTILEEFDKDDVFQYGVFSTDAELTQDVITDRVKDFLTQSIKDALEACRVGVRLPHENATRDINILATGYNQAATQYDENVKSFLGE